MDFNEYQKKIDSEKIIVAELKPGLDLSIMTLSTGTNTWYLDIERIGKKNSGLYHYPDFSDVYEDGAVLTEATGKSSVDREEGSWFFDEEAGRIFVHTSDNATPSNLSLYGVFPLYFSNSPVVCENRCYNPRISDVPISISSNAEDIYFSTTTVGGGSISFENSDGLFDILSCRYLWKNRDISIALGESDMTIGSYATIFSGRLRDRQMDDQRITFTIQDRRQYLFKDLPANVFTKDDYPNLGEGNEEKGIPIGYGHIEKAPAYLIDSTEQKGKYKFADHPVYDVIKVYNNGSPINSSKYSVDEENGEFTILSGYTGTPEAITVDFLGCPCDSEIIYTNDFDDNDISDWTEYGTGGSYDWTVENGVVTGTSQDNYSTYLIQENVSFSAGEIEVDVTPQTNGGDHSWGQAIIFDWQNINNWRVLIIFPNADYVRIAEMQGGQWTPLDSCSMQIAAGTKYTLKLVVTENGLAEGYVNDVKKVTYDFGEPFTPRPAGFRHGQGGDADFDNISIKMPYMVLGSQIVKDICTRFLDIPESDIDNNSFDNALEKAKQSLSVYIPSGKCSSMQIISRISASNLCRFLVGADNKIYYAYWDQSDSESIEISDEVQLDGYECSEQTDDIFYKVRINYNFSPESGFQDEAVYSEDWVKNTYNRPYEKSFETYLTKESDAENLAYKLFQLVKSPTLRVKIKTKTLGINLKVGDVIKLKRKRAYSASGSIDGKYRIIGINKELDLAQCTLTLINDSDALGVDICSQQCQYSCESSCQADCQLGCQEVCEAACQGDCQQNCMTGCQVNCQTGCEVSCEIGCEVQCENCEGACQSGCEVSCQDICETSCQSACESSCQEGCEISCEEECQQSFKEIYE